MERRRLKIKKKKKSLIAGSSPPARMKLQLWSHFQLRREPQVGLSSRRPSRRRRVLREETRSRERSGFAPALAPSPWLAAPCAAETPVPVHPLRLELSSSPAPPPPRPLSPDK